MQRAGKSYEPVMLGHTPVGNVQRLRFEVEVHYQLTTGVVSVFKGSFYAVDANGAEQAARHFVTRFIRPSHIVEVVVGFFRMEEPHPYPPPPPPAENIGAPIGLLLVLTKTS